VYIISINLSEGDKFIEFSITTLMDAEEEEEEEEEGALGSLQAL